MVGTVDSFWLGRFVLGIAQKIINACAEIGGKCAQP